MSMQSALLAGFGSSKPYIVFFPLRQTVEAVSLVGMTLIDYIKQEAIMSGEQPSNEQLKASQVQSLADQTGNNKEQASKLQSEADRRAVPKHGL